MKKIYKIKRILRTCAVFLTGFVLMASTAVFTSCAKAPAVEDIYDRVVELVEDSYELNTVFFGAGLPVYQTDSAYAEFTHLYYGFSYAGDYEIVMPYAKFASEQEIKAAAEKVYSKAYLTDVLYPSTFDGYAIDDGMGDSAFAYARYMLENDTFYQSTRAKTYVSDMRIYDYSTMQVVSPSSADACYVTMDSWLESDPDAVTVVRLRLVNQDGVWYLDSFSG